MTEKLDERIATLEERLRQLRVRHQRLESRKRVAASRSTRRADTRRRMLVGAVVLDRIEQGKFEEEILRVWLERALQRTEDRALFGL